MSFKTTKFCFVNAGADTLTMEYIMVYTTANDWKVLSDGEPQYDENPGIGWPSIVNSNFDKLKNCSVSLRIDSEIVNRVPYASDKASLLFDVNGSNIHIDIHSGGGMKVTGIYGPDSDAIHWDYNISDVGGVTTFTCMKQ